MFIDGPASRAKCGGGKLRTPHTPLQNVDVANKFWVTLGGEPAALGAIKLMKFPGVLLYISVPRGTPTPAIEGNHGTTVEFISFKVKDVKASLAK